MDGGTQVLTLNRETYHASRVSLASHRRHGAILGQLKSGEDDTSNCDSAIEFVLVSNPRNFYSKFLFWEHIRPPHTRARSHNLRCNPFLAQFESVEYWAMSPVSGRAVALVPYEASP